MCLCCIIECEMWGTLHRMPSVTFACIMCGMFMTVAGRGSKIMIIIITIREAQKKDHVTGLPVPLPVSTSPLQTCLLVRLNGILYNLHVKLRRYVFKRRSAIFEIREKTI